MGPLARILVGVDGSKDGERALVWAAELSVALGAELVVVHVVGLISRVHGEPEPAVAVIDALEEMVAGAWTDPARAVGAQPRTCLETGPPAMAIERVAAREDVDLIVVGSRGAGAPGRFESGLGSTSCSLAHSAERPLAVIPTASWSRPSRRDPRRPNSGPSAL